MWRFKANNLDVVSLINKAFIKEREVMTKVFKKLVSIFVLAIFILALFMFSIVATACEFGGELGGETEELPIPTEPPLIEKPVLDAWTATLNTSEIRYTVDSWRSLPNRQTGLLEFAINSKYIRFVNWSHQADRFSIISDGINLNIRSSNYRLDLDMPVYSYILYLHNGELFESVYDRRNIDMQEDESISDGYQKFVIHDEQGSFDMGRIFEDFLVQEANLGGPHGITAYVHGDYVRFYFHMHEGFSREAIFDRYNRLIWYATRSEFRFNPPGGFSTLEYRVRQTRFVWDNNVVVPMPNVNLFARPPIESMTINIANIAWIQEAIDQRLIVRQGHFLWLSGRAILNFDGIERTHPSWYFIRVEFDGTHVDDIRISGNGGTIISIMLVDWWQFLRLSSFRMTVSSVLNPSIYQYIDITIR